MDPWRVRVHHGDAVTGAGILITDRWVLTCAHVLPGGIQTDRDWPLSVHLPGVEHASHVPARVVDGAWVPPVDDGETVGDLALLELRRPVPGPPAAVRRQHPLPGRRVRLCGYPDLREAGFWVEAEVAGPSGPWWQLKLERAGDVSPGFSGGGVLDVGNGAVIGMVVAGLDSLAEPVHLLVTTADRETRAGLGDLLRGPRGRLATAGSIDIAIDAAGRTTQDVCGRLASFVGVDADDPGELVRAIGAAAPSLTVVIDSVDEAVDANSLFVDLLLPLATAGARILAGSRSAQLPPAAAEHVATVDLDAPVAADEPPALPHLPVAARPERLDGLVAQTAVAATAAVNRRAQVADRVEHAPTFTDHVTSLRLKVADLRRQVAAQPADRRDGADVHEAIAGAERRAQAAGQGGDRLG